MIDKIFNYIIENSCGDDIHDEIQEAKIEYLDDGWEEEFEDMEEAYTETGRCAAECEVVNSLVRAACKQLDVPEDDEVFMAVYDKVVDQFDIEQDS